MKLVERRKNSTDSAGERIIGVANGAVSLP